MDRVVTEAFACHAETMNKTIAKLGRRLRLGVIGGGPGSFIGPVHRAAARLDDNFEIVASVLSSDPARSRKEGRAIGVAADRAYGSPDEMFATEKARADGIEVVAIMTPNDSHCALSRAAIEHGLDIICDKPLATNLDDALDLREARQGLRSRLLPDLQLHRLPAPSPGARHGPRRRPRRDPHGECRVRARPQRGAYSRRARRPAGQLALPPGEGRSVAHPWRYRQPCASHGHLRHRTAFRPRHGGHRGGRAEAESPRPCRHPLPPRKRRSGGDVGDAGRGRRRPWTPFPRLW